MNHKKLLKFFAAAVVLCLALTGQAFTADTSQNIATLAAGVSVKGRVTSYLPGVSCTVQLCQGDAVRYSTVSFLGSGAGLGTQEFIIPGVADGIYDLVITKPGHLNYTIRNIVVQGSDVDLTTNDNDLVSDITLVAGDINGDGCVDLKDLIVLTSSDNFGKSPVVTVFDNGAADNPEDLTGLDDFLYETTEDGITITGVKDKTKTAYVVPDSVTGIGPGAFSGCTNLTNITIPDSVTSIGSAAFYGCTNLTSITIPDSVTSIGNSAFTGCTNLTNITIPDSVTSIGGYAFYGCTSLTSITIPDSVTSIETCAFNVCTSLTSITIPDSVESIENEAFFRCSSLTSVTIPDSVISIGKRAFYNCTNLTSITYGGTKTQWEAITKGTDWDLGTGNYTITYEGESTGLDDFLYETTENGITITGVKDPTKTEYVIPDSVIGIGESAFESCLNMTNVTIPGSVTSIGEEAFYNCYNLTSITIPDSVTNIGKYAFQGCSSLTSVYITDIAAWCKIPFGDYSSNPLYNGGNLYLNGVLVTNLVIPESVTSIGDRAFYGCTSLTSITIPDSVTSIGNSAFWGCTSRTSVYITDIAAWCKISFVTSSSNPLNNGGNLYLNGVLVTNLVIPESVTSIGDYAFRGCSSLTSATIGNGVTSIGDAAFSYCSGLTSVTIGNSVTSIGSFAFQNCTSLTSVTIPDSVTGIGNVAFYNCSSLTSITIPDSVTSIGNAAFYWCTSLTSITIPDSVTSIGNYAFYGCTSLTSITYRGTQTQWDAITKGTDWDLDTGNYTITYNYTGE